MNNTISELIETLDNLKNALSKKEEELTQIQLANKWAKNLFDNQEKIKSAEKRIKELILQNTEETEKPAIEKILEDFKESSTEELINQSLFELVYKVEELQFQIHFCKNEQLKKAFSILNNDGLTSFLQQAQEEFPQLGESLHSSIFVFEDIYKLQDISIQKILREVDTQELAVALKGASEKVKNAIFNNMSKRAGEMLKQDLEFFGNISKKNIIIAQNKISSLIFKMVNNGDIVLPRIDFLPEHVQEITQQDL